MAVNGDFFENNKYEVIKLRRKPLVFTVIFLLAALICIIVLFTQTGKDESASPLPPTGFSGDPSPMYVMKSYGEIIGIYNYGESEPVRLVNVTVRKLPKKDIDSLEKGIEIYSKDELNSLLEDFDQ